MKTKTVEVALHEPVEQGNDTIPSLRCLIPGCLNAQTRTVWFEKSKDGTPPGDTVTYACDDHGAAFYLGGGEEPRDLPINSDELTSQFAHGASVVGQS